MTQAEHRAAKAAYHRGDIVDPRYRCAHCGRLDFQHDHRCHRPVIRFLRWTSDGWVPVEVRA